MLPPCRSSCSSCRSAVLALSSSSQPQATLLAVISQCSPCMAMQLPAQHLLLLMMMRQCAAMTL
jgi:hypothetical protein